MYGPVPYVEASYGCRPSNSTHGGSSSSDQKKRIERAANIKGLSLSDFMVQNADEAAIRTIQQHESWTLATKDRTLFVGAIRNPVEPSDRLKSAAKRYKERA